MTQTTKHNQQPAIVYLGLLLENWNFLNFLSSTRNQKITFETFQVSFELPWQTVPKQLLR